MSTFSDPNAVARYADGPPRMVPGFAGLQRMAMVLLAEKAPSNARVLVVGAGGGLEIKAFAEAQPSWRFDGVDPLAEMLKLAIETIGEAAARTHLYQGLIDVAPPGPFDAATCILTMHFIERDERLRTLKEIRSRLAPGAPFVVAHFSIPAASAERNMWLARYAAFAVASGMDPKQMTKARTGIGDRLPILTPHEDEQLLREAGFVGVSPFYMAFTFRGWVAYA